MELSRIWHCPRPKLAQAYLQLLGSGLVVSTCIFAPRRTGKTVFLRQDLTPAAQQAGYAVAYADLWQTPLDPGTALVRALEEALQAKSLGSRVMKGLRTPIKKLKASAEVSSIKGEVELELDAVSKQATDTALRIDDLAAALCAKKPLLLLVDEAQELARTQSNEWMARALRTAMTKHRDRLRVVFTGSSRSQLAHVFSDAQAPLYSVGATVQEFPALDRELVEFVAARFEAACGRKLDVGTAWAYFDRDFQHKPEPFLQAIVAMLMNPGLSLHDACQQELRDDARRENHEATWASLDALQRSLVQLLQADPTTLPFSKATLAAAAKQSKRKDLKVHHVQWALRQLAERNIVSKNARGVYTFDNPAFERWVADALTPPH